LTVPDLLSGSDDHILQDEAKLILQSSSFALPFVNNMIGDEGAGYVSESSAVDGMAVLEQERRQWWLWIGSR
jgi:hypothetical protein